MAIRESLLDTINTIATSDFVRAVTSAGASRKVTVANLINTIRENMPVATQSDKGAMSASDKAKLDGLAENDFVSFKIGDDTVSAELGDDAFEFVSTDHIKASKSGKGVRFDPYGLAPSDHASTNSTYGVGTDEKFGHVKLTHSIANPSSATNAGVGITPYGVKTALDNLKTGVSDVKVLGKLSKNEAAEYQTQVDGDGNALLDNSDFGFASIQEAANIGTGPASGASFGTSGQNGISLADGGIILIKFTSDVGASSVLTLGYDAPGSSGEIPIYYNGSAISAGIIKANDVVALQFDNANNRWHLINRVYKTFGSTTDGLVPYCGVPMSDEICILTSDGWQTIVTYGSYLSLNDYVSAKLVNPTLYDFETSLTPSIDARGVYDSRFIIVPHNTADLTVENMRKIEAYLAADFEVSVTCAGYYRLIVTHAYINTNLGYFFIVVKSIDSSTQLSSSSSVSGTLHIVAPFEIDRVTSPM